MTLSLFILRPRCTELISIKEALKTIRLAIDRGQALDSDRFREMIESAIGRRGEHRRGGSPRRASGGIDGEQTEFGF